MRDIYLPELEDSQIRIHNTQLSTDGTMILVDYTAVALESSAIDYKVALCKLLKDNYVWHIIKQLTGKDGLPSEASRWSEDGSKIIVSFKNTINIFEAQSFVDCLIIE